MELYEVRLIGCEDYMLLKQKKVFKRGEWTEVDPLTFQTLVNNPNFEVRINSGIRAVSEGQNDEHIVRLVEDGKEEKGEGVEPEPTAEKPKEPEEPEEKEVGGSTRRKDLKRLIKK